MSSTEPNVYDYAYDDVNIGGVNHEYFEFEGHAQEEVNTVYIPAIKEEKILKTLSYVLFVIGLLITSIAVAVAVTVVVMNRRTDKKAQCFWTDWSSWSECSVTCGNGTLYRVKQQGGIDRSCSHNETIDSRICSLEQCQVNEFELDMKFDQSTLFRYWYLSDHNTIISNHQTNETRNSPNGENQLEKYEGVIANVCIEDNNRIYYEVAYSYKIISTLQYNWLVLEIGLGERDKIDKYYYVGGKEPRGWSFNLYNCEDFNKVCLAFNHNGSIEQSRNFSDNTAGTSVEGKFGILVDRVKNEFLLINNDTVIYKFQNTTSEAELCPVFGVYNPHSVKVELQIINVFNFTNIPLIQHKIDLINYNLDFYIFLKDFYNKYLSL